MRVLLNCLSSRSGGAVAYLRNLVPLLRPALETHDADLLALGRPDQQALLEAIPATNQVLVRNFVGSSLGRSLWERLRLASLIRSLGVDVLFTPYQVGTLGPGVRNVVMLRNMEPFFGGEYEYSVRSRLRNEALRAATARCLRAADAVIAVSDFAARVATESLHVDPIGLRRIYHGRDLAFGSDSESVDLALRDLGLSDRPFIFTCGSILPYRRVEDIVAGYGRAVSGQAEPPRLVIAGTGTDERYSHAVMASIRSSPARSSIDYLGQVSRESMVALYRRSKLFVTATEVEACPNIAIEAMTAGCTIISSATPVMREMFRDGALFYSPRDVDSLTEVIRSTLLDAGMAADLRNRAVRRAEAFSWESCARETAQCLVDGGPTRPTGRLQASPHR